MNKFMSTPLHEACSRENLRVFNSRDYQKLVKILLVGGANIEHEKTRSCRDIANLRTINIFQKWPITMFIVVLKELVVYHLLDCDSFRDLLQYMAEVPTVDNEYEYDKHDKHDMCGWGWYTSRYKFI